MIVCPKCGKELADGTKFCSKCGEKLAAPAPAPEKKAEETVTCPKCGKQVKAGVKFCMSCGAPLSAEAQKAEEVKVEATKAEEKLEEFKKDEFKPEPVKAEETKKEEPKKEEAKVEEPKKEEPKKEEAKAEEPKKEEPKKEEAKKGFFSNPTVKYCCIALAAVLVLILLGSLLSGGGSGAGGKHYAMYLKDREIYYSNLTKKGAWQVSTRLVKDGAYDNYTLVNRYYVYQCTLSEDGKTIFFPDKLESGDDGVTLYSRSVSNQKKEPQKIDSSIYYYQVNKAATFVTYCKSSDDLYQFNLKKEEKDKIDSEVKDYVASEDGGKVYYMKDSGELYVWTRAKKEKEKLDSDINRIIYVTKDNKTIYYLKDGILYRKTGTKDKEKISSDVEKVYAVYDSGEIYFTKESALWYYDGKEGEKITDKFQRYMACGAESAVIAYAMSDDDNKKVYCVAVKKNVTEVEQEDVDSFLIDQEGKYAYFVAELDSKGEAGELYKMTISGGKASSKAEKVDDEVCTSYLRLTESDQILYFKDYSGNKGELYCDKKKIDTDVHGASVTFCTKSKQVVYLGDYDTNKEKGTLKIAGTKSGKPKKIADDIYADLFTVAPDGSVLYLNDYSTKSYKGELYLFKGKATKLDDEVSAIIKFN